MDNQIVSKIRKLLKLAGSPNEHEARLATEMANDLLIRHNISMQQVAQASGETIKEKGQYTARFVRVEDKWLCQILKDYFFIEIMARRQSIGLNSANQTMWKTILVFLGTETNVEVASFTYDYLVRQYRNLWLTYKAESGKPEKARQAYYLGLTRGLAAQLAARRQKVETETGLVVVASAALQAHMKSLKLKKAKSSSITHDHDAVASGTRAGKDLNVVQGLKPQEPRGSVAAATLSLPGK